MRWGRESEGGQGGKGRKKQGKGVGMCRCGRG